LELLELKSNIRTTTGKNAARVLRREERIPAVLYGPETSPVLLSVHINDLDQVLKNTRSGQLVLNLVIQNGETYTKTTMIKELQIHPVSHNFIHVDFYEISMDRKIVVKIPVEVKGKSKGVEAGGTLQIIRHELEILCLPALIPDSIEINIADLDIGDSIHLSDISLEGDMEFSEEAHLTVVTVLAPKMEEEPEKDEEAEELSEGKEPTESGEEE
jgi:large subunit ribosomal protein L25